MQQLKALVITMGLLIVLGVTFLVYAIATGLHKKTTDTSPTNSFGHHTVTLDPTQTLEQQTLDDGRLILQIRDSQTGHLQWQVWDIVTGQQLGSLTLRQP